MKKRLRLITPYENPPDMTVEDEALAEELGTFGDHADMMARRVALRYALTGMMAAHTVRMLTALIDLGIQANGQTMHAYSLALAEESEWQQGVARIQAKK